MVAEVEEGLSKKAQVPPQMVARSNAAVGAGDTVNELVTGLVPKIGSGTAVTVVFAANVPGPENIATLVAGVVTAGMLDVEGRYIVAPGVPALSVLALLT